MFKALASPFSHPATAILFAMTAPAYLLILGPVLLIAEARREKREAETAKRVAAIEARYRR